MIVTLTPNPSVDRTVVLQQLGRGETNYVNEVHINPSGKGINVSRALDRLGIPSVAMGFLGGSEGKFIAEQLQDSQIEQVFTWLDQGNTRQNTKVYEKSNSLTTEINELGPIISRRAQTFFWTQLLKILPAAKFLVCSGSLPPGIEPKFYSQVITECRRAGVKVCLDTSGTPLLEGVKERPDFIKPNRAEAEMVLDRSIDDRQGIRLAMLDLIALDIPLVVLSLGEQGAIFYQEGQPLYWGRAMAESVESTAGCGDSLVAALLIALDEDMVWEDTVRWAVAFATATAELAGTNFPDRSHIAKVLPRVQLEEF